MSEAVSQAIMILNDEELQKNYHEEVIIIQNQLSLLKNMIERKNRKFHIDLETYKIYKPTLFESITEYSNYDGGDDSEVRGKK